MIKKILILLMVVFLGYTVFQSTILPGWVEHIVRTNFEHAGYPVKSIQIQFFSTENAEFKNITFATASRMKVDSLKATYSFRDLMKGRIRTIEVAGLQIEMDLNNVEKNESAIAHSELDIFANKQHLPFDSVQFDLSHLLIKRGETRLHIPFSGWGTRHTNDFEFHLVSDLLGGSLECNGMFSGKEEKLHIETKINALNPGLFPEEIKAPSVRFPLAGMIQGRIVTDISEMQRTSRIDISLRLSAEPRSTPVELNQARITGTYTRDDFGSALDVAASIEQLKVHGYMINNVSIAANNKNDGIFVELKGSGQNLSFEKCTIALAGVPDLQVLFNDASVIYGVVMQGQVHISKLRAYLAGFTIASPAVSVEAYAKVDSDGMKFNDIRLSVTDADLSQGALQCRGINSKWTVNEFYPLNTPNGQLITIDEASWSQFDFQNGRVMFGIESPTSVFIERSDWDFCDGRVSCRPFRFNPHDDTINAQAFFEELQLNKAMEMLVPGFVNAEGYLYGRVPLYFRWRDPLQLRFRSGYLYTIPSTGRLQVRDKSMISDLYLGEMTRTDSMPQQIDNSLNDFEYSLFKIDFESEDSAVTEGKIHIRGKGLDDDSLPLGLSVDFDLHH